MTTGCRCLSSSTVRPRRSRTSARASSRPPLRACMPQDAAPLTILVATSGDTGGAVAAAFHRRPGIRVVVLFPKGLVSPTQERQLTCWGDNVRSLSVRGTFDDCQRLVKEAFRDRVAAGRARRCPPPTASTSGACCRRRSTTPPPASASAASTASAPRSWFPAVTSATWSPACGRAAWACRSDEVVLAHNANRTVPDYLDTGEW